MSYFKKNRLETFIGYYGDIASGTFPQDIIKGEALSKDDAFLETLRHLINDYMTEGGPDIQIFIKNSSINWDAEYRVSLDNLYRIIGHMGFRTKCKLTSRAWRKNNELF